ncbi:MAG: hypothetical protein SGARI_002196 [Bacillariaceae sp.]
MHPGNEWFRRLVRSNRTLYKTCPKHTKLLVAKAVVQAVQQQDPPGRFLERKKEANSNNYIKGLWFPIDYKKAVDKTSQALREKESEKDDEGDLKAPQANPSEIQAAVAHAEHIRNSKNFSAEGLVPLTQHALKSAGYTGEMSWKPKTKPRKEPPEDPNIERIEAGGIKKRKQINPADFVKPSWWSRGTPLMTPITSLMPFAAATKHFVSPAVASMNGSNNKRMKMTTPNGIAENGNAKPAAALSASDDPLPLPMASLETRQSSLFRFLGNSGIFGGAGGGTAGLNRAPSTPLQPGQSGLFRGTSPQPPSATAAAASGVAASLGGGFAQPLNMGDDVLESGAVMGRLQIKKRSADDSDDGDMKMAAIPRNAKRSKGSLLEDSDDDDDEDGPVPIPTKKLTSQVSDWLSGFFQAGKAAAGADNDDPLGVAGAKLDFTDVAAGSAASPPGGGEPLSRSVSSSIFGLIESPSIFLSTLKSGVSTVFGGGGATEPLPVPNKTPGNMSPIPPAPPLMQAPGQGLFGQPSAPAKRRDSLLDDYEETPMETKLRNITSN